MPFGLCNSPQIYQRLIDNALYEFWKLSPTENTRDVIKDGIPSKPGTRSVLSRRSYIDDILIGGTSWDDLCKKVECLLEVCEEWHLSISVEKSEWGMSKVDYLGHEVSEDGLGAKPKSLETLATLDFPVYAAALYSLSARDFEVRVSNPETRDLDKWTHAPVVIVYASDWAVSAVLAQNHDGVYLPVKFTSRMLKPNELNYSIAEKEILALLHVLNECHNMLAGRTICVLTRHTTLGWIFRSEGLQGRLAQWAAILSPWRLEILRSVKGEEEILGTLAASITLRAYANAALEEITPRKRPAFSAVVWKLPNWDVVRAASGYVEGLTVYEAEYRGMLLGISLLDALDVARLIICGGSNLEIRQMRGEMDCKRDWNASADMLAGQALQRQEDNDVYNARELEDLRTLNRLGEVVRPTTHDAEGGEHVLKTETRDPDDPALEAETYDPDNAGRGTRRVCPVITRSRDASNPAPRRQPEVLKVLEVQRLRLDRVCTAQGEEAWIVNLKKFLDGDISELSRREAKNCAKIAEHLSFQRLIEKTYCTTTTQVWKTGIRASAGRINGRQHFHWPGLFKSVQRHIGECVDCKTGKGRPTIRGESPGNIVATYPFQVVAMDHIPSLPASHKGNTELSIWVGLFTGFVIAQASAEAIRHDREPGYMSDFFGAFNKLMGQRQRATLAYRPQANGAAERMVQTIARAIKMYMADIDQRDWDQYAERLTYALNTAHDRTRDETPFFLVHGWDPRSTLERSDASLWLYLDRVKPGYARKLAHMWHGPFRVVELVSAYAVRLETNGTPYQLFPIVHVSKLKPVREFPSRPELRLTVPVNERFDFDEELLPEDSWETRDVGEDVYEVEQILDTREGRMTRYGRTRRKFRVKWRGYDETSWVDELDLNCGGLVYDFLRQRTGRSRFGVMQSHEDAPAGE
ncbi:reverse transcriptase, partial [Phytophthora megakarya]